MARIHLSREALNLMLEDRDIEVLMWEVEDGVFTGAIIQTTDREALDAIKTAESRYQQLLATLAE